MTRKPLLIFPRPDKLQRKKSNPVPPIPPSYHIPDFIKQKDILTPKFESMLESFITDTPDGIEPEYVLVLETVGKIEDFQKAAKWIEGLEWLAEIDEEDLASDEDYYQKLKIGKRFFSDNIKDLGRVKSEGIYNILQKNGFIGDDEYFTDKSVDHISKFLPDEFYHLKDEIISKLKDEIAEQKTHGIGGRLFLSMSNRQAMAKLISLWKEWDNPEKKLKRRFGKWAEVFRHLKSIRPWDIQDRLRDTGIDKYWEEELEIKRGTASTISFEVELWYRRDTQKRMEVKKHIEKLILEEKGHIIAGCEIDEIRFFSIKAELPSESIIKVCNHEYTKLFLSNDVMFFRPSGQTVVEKYLDGEIGSYTKGIGIVSGDPVVAILDGSPFANHELLENRLIPEDPDYFDSDYLVNERKHGTAMASLICHGELDANEPSLTRPVYIRPIMKPDENDRQSPRREYIPDNIFLEDILQRSVRRIFDGEDNTPADAPTVKVINLSIGDTSRMFFNRLSPTARLLDWLSNKYQVLFCVSAGNIVEPINLKKKEVELKSLSEEELIKHTMREMYSNLRYRRLLAPAESLNAITVGALHRDQSNLDYLGNRIDILPTPLLPSPISAIGNGFRNSIKPEIYLPGGKQLYNYNSDNKYAIDNSTRAPGQRVATTPLNSGELNRLIYTRGTSNAAALATRAAAQIFEVLNELREKENNKFDIPDNRIAVILKTLLIHSASWGKSQQLLEECLKNKNNARQFKRTLSRFLGFGIPDIRRVLECTEQRATAIGSGEIAEDERHEFKLPLPPGLSGSREMRRLTITLAWFSPINPDHRKFRKASLSFNPPQDAIGVKRKEADWKQVKNGTVQHEILEGEESQFYQDGEFIVIPVECRSDAGKLDEKVHYGIAVTLEVAEGVDINVYEEIKERINVPVPIHED